LAFHFTLGFGGSESSLALPLELGRGFGGFSSIALDLGLRDSSFEYVCIQVTL
jgi:hypothetical protein